MRSYLWRAITLVVVLSMMIPLAVAAAPDAPQPQAPLTPGGVGVQPNPENKLDAELRQLAVEGGTEPVLVYILAKAGADLSNVVDVTEVRPFLGDELVVADVTPDKIVKMAGDSAVLAAEVFHPIEVPSPISPKEDRALALEKVRELRQKAAARQAEYQSPSSQVSGSIDVSASAGPQGAASPQSWYGKSVIGAPEAWDKGYMGQGVNVAIVDSGVDFGHPDLDGAQATYENGPYAGWPIALDPRSMRNLYYRDYTSWDNYNSRRDRSWYAGVYDVLHCTAGTIATFSFNGYTYTLSADVAGMSKSGEVRWSVHPDNQLADFVYDWVPFILLDTVTAGVYDTVIADLNFDLWFDQYDDVVAKADPVLSQDLGSYLLTDTEVMTGTQYVPATWWAGGNAPTWWGPPQSSAYMSTTVGTETLPAGTWIWAMNHWTMSGATDGADGIADVSGGMVYYIADGKLPVPGMGYLYPDFGIPFNGQLVAFMIGSNNAGGGDHGTLCASATAARGVITSPFAADLEMVQYQTYEPVNFPFGTSTTPPLPFLKPADQGTVQGPAPMAKIIALGDNYQSVHGMQGFYDSYTFLAYGVDGVPNSGDEFVDVVSMSYGSGYVNNDGWDWESRLLTYYNTNYLPNTTLMISAGNGGYGYGTVNSPGPVTAVKVAASTQYGGTDTFGGALTLEQINNGEIQPFSDRGPDAMGRPAPHVAANGAWGTGDIPLNLAVVSGGVFPGDGNTAWEEWGGTSRSAPESAGVMALTYNAYYSNTSTMPTYETARELIMSSANDLSHDVLMQGSGRVNADRATDVAGGLEGIYVSPGLLTAGQYGTTDSDGFAHVLYPGDTDTLSLTVYNPGTTAKTVTVGDEMLMAMETITYNQVVTPYMDAEDPTYPNAYYYYANYFVQANPAEATGTFHGEDLVVPVPAGADLMQVQLMVPMEIYSFDYVEPGPVISYTWDQRWSLTVYDWEDRNENDVLWEDTNGDGIVNPISGTDVVDIAYTGPTTMTEINRFAYSYLYGDAQEVTVRLTGPDRTGENTPNIVLGLVHRNNNDTRPGWGAAEYQANPLQVKVVFYQKVDVPWMDESSTSLNIAAGADATFDVAFTIPAAMPPGLYEGAVVLDDGTHKSLVPTTVNVAVPQDELLFDLGGTPPAGTPYDNGRGFGAWTWNGNTESSDWRFYYYDAAAGFQQQYLYVRNDWGTLCSNMPTFYQTLVWGPKMGDQFSMMDPDLFGPYSLAFAGGSPDSDGYGIPFEGSWWTNADDTALPESREWVPLYDGLNQVQFRNILLSGMHNCGEGFAATSGVFGVDAPDMAHGGIQLDVSNAEGTFSLDAISPIDGLFAYASGFGQSEWFRNQDVPQGHPSPSWPAFLYAPDDLLAGAVYTFTATNLEAIEASSFGPDSSDIDLYLLYDANGDGVFNLESNQEVLAESAEATSEEEIVYSTGFNGLFIPNGTYAVVMYGYDVFPGDQFDLRLTTYGGEDLNVVGANADNNYTLSVTPGEPQSLEVHWRVPGSGIWQGLLAFAMPWEEEPQNYYQGPPILVPVTINYNAYNFAGSSKTVDKSVVRAYPVGGSAEVLTYTITLINGGNVDVPVVVSDLLPEGAIYHEQFNGASSYVAEWWYENGEHGYFSPDENGYLNWSGTVGPTTSGQLHIQYQVKVEAGFAGTIMNKADVSIGSGEDGDFHEFMALTASTEVHYAYYLPAVYKDSMP